MRLRENCPPPSPNRPPHWWVCLLRASWRERNSERIQKSIEIFQSSPSSSCERRSWWLAITPSSANCTLPCGRGRFRRRRRSLRKKQLFGEIQGECKAITPNPKSFNKCLSANNNAGLAFDMTYAKHYPLMYELYLASGQDLKATVSATKKALAARSEPEALRRLQNLINE